MKKILLAIFCIPLFSYAQKEKTFEIGAHLNFHSNNHSGLMQYGNREKQNTLFTDGGLSLQYYLKDNFSLVGEINYKTLDTEKHDPDGLIGSSRHVTETFQSSIIEIPLMARYHYRFNNWKIFGNLGPTINFHVKNPEAKFSYDAFQIQNPPFETVPGVTIDEDLKNYFSTVYLGYGAGLGVAYQWNTKWLVTIEYRITQSFANNAKDKIGSYDTEVQIKDFKYNANQFTIGVGYKL
jgi:opacity protein-like surface antigen